MWRCSLYPELLCEYIVDFKLLVRYRSFEDYVGFSSLFSDFSYGLTVNKIIEINQWSLVEALYGCIVTSSYD